MFDCRYDQAVSLGAVESHVVGLGTASGKYHLFRAGADHGRNLVACQFHCIARVTSELMYGRRVSSHRQRLGYRFAYLRFDWSCSVIVKINCFSAVNVPAHSAAEVA